MAEVLGSAARLLFPPYRRTHLDVRLIPEALVERVRASVHVTGQSDEELPFAGRVTDTGFELTRRIMYRNSFLPLIIGRFEPSDLGTRVQLVLRLQVLPGLFWMVWMAIALVFFVGSVVSWAGGGPSAAVGMTFGLLAFGWLLCSVSFELEARAAMSRLRAALGAETGELSASTGFLP